VSVIVFGSAAIGRLPSGSSGVSSYLRTGAVRTFGARSTTWRPGAQSPTEGLTLRRLAAYSAFSPVDRLVERDNNV
jgi:hypothetical protein